MEKYVSTMTCADFIVSTPDYFRYNLSADEFITQAHSALNSVTDSARDTTTSTVFFLFRPRLAKAI